MNQTAIDHFLKTDEFKTFIRDADAWGTEHGCERWANRVAWVALAMNTRVAKRYAQRRACYQYSRAWAAYNNLLEFGLFSEDPEGVVYEAGDENWGDSTDPYDWMSVVVQAAEGQKPPEDFPSLLE